MTEPWDEALVREPASPAVQREFAASARALARDLSGSDWEALERCYRNRYDCTDAADPRLDHLLRTALQDDDEASRDLLETDDARHRNVFRAVAAQSLLNAGGEDQRAAIGALAELASQHDYAEAAALLAVWSDAPTSEAKRSSWQQIAEPAVATINRR